MILIDLHGFSWIFMPWAPFGHPWARLWHLWAPSGAALGAPWAPLGIPWAHLGHPLKPAGTLLFPSCEKEQRNNRKKSFLGALLGQGAHAIRPCRRSPNAYLALISDTVFQTSVLSPGAFANYPVVRRLRHDGE